MRGLGKSASMVSFQAAAGVGAYRMDPHGHPDPTTMINQGRYDPLEQWPRRHTQYLVDGGEKPGTFFRDLQGVSNQVPRWAWFVTSGTFLIFGAVAYRNHKKAKRGNS